MNDDFWRMTEQDKEHVSKAIEALRYWKQRIVDEGYDRGSKERVAELDQAINYLTSCLKRANEPV